MHSTPWREEGGGWWLTRRARPREGGGEYRRDLAIVVFLLLLLEVSEQKFRRSGDERGNVKAPKPTRTTDDEACFVLDQNKDKTGL